MTTFTRRGTPTGGGLSVLVVDGRRDHAESSAELIRLFGHRAEVATSGPDALAAVARFRPDVVLLGMEVPAMNGYEIARRITAPRPGLTPVVIAVTGYGGAADRERTADAGFDLHLVKPVDPATLRGLLTRIQWTLAPDEGHPQETPCRPKTTSCGSTSERAGRGQPAAAAGGSPCGKTTPPILHP